MMKMYEVFLKNEQDVVSIFKYKSDAVKYLRNLDRCFKSNQDEIREVKISKIIDNQGNFRNL